MKKNKLFLLIYIMCMVSLSLLYSVQVEADNRKSEGIGFSVATQFNSQQIDPNSSYFYLLCEPGKEQTVKVKIKSTRKKPIEIKMTVLNGMTTGKVAIGYEKEKIAKRDESLDNAVTDMVELTSDKVTVENFEEKIIEVKIKPFKESFEGVKLGAINFVGKEKEQNSAMAVETGYQLGVVLASNGEQFNNGKEFKLVDVKAGLDNGQPSVLPKFQNPHPYTIENLKIKASVSEKKSGKKIKEKEITGGSIAPNSSFQMPVEWGLTELKSGTYHFSMTAKNDFYDWKFEKDFDVTAKDAQNISENSRFKVVTPKWIQSAAIVESVFIIIISIYLIIRRKKNTKKYKELKKNKNKNKKKKGKKGQKRK